MTTQTYQAIVRIEGEELSVMVETVSREAATLAILQHYAGATIVALDTYAEAAERAERHRISTYGEPR